MALRSRTAALTAVPAVVLVLVTACTSSGGRSQPSSARPSSPPPVTASSAPAASTAPPTTSTSMPPSSPVRTVLLSKLNGATVPTTFIVEDDTPGVTEAKFYLTTQNKTFLSSARAAPFDAAISVNAGVNSLQVRHEINGDRVRLSVTFTAKAALLPGGLSASSRPSDPNTGPIPVPAATVNVTTSAELATALRQASPGTVIHLADGQYMNDKGRRWQLAKSGTAGQPITLEGDRAAILESDSPSGDYGISVTGSYWQILGLTVRNATKGIVLDNSQHTIIDNVEVYNIGDEGVHFRTCSSDGVLQNSYVHDTGMKAPNFGEGVYVGSANSNWSHYGCRDGQDKSENNTIRDNTFKHIAAEGADLKEGTDSGTLSGNTFVEAGYSGENSADSAVDAKGNHWMISDNTATDPSGADLDAFQTHSVYAGYGTANIFTGNTIVGAWPGFGIALYPQAANIVACNNSAPDAAKGLVGSNGQPVKCAG